MNSLLELPRSLDLPNNRMIESVEGQLLSAQRIGEITTLEIPLTHRFAPGVYLREVMMPAGSFVIGHEHKTEHFNIVLQGVATVMIAGELRLLSAPRTFISEPGVRKVLYIHEDMIFQTIHPNPLDIRDLNILESLHVIKSASYDQHLAELKQLQRALENESR